MEFRVMDEKDPVIIASDGYSYGLHYLSKWYKNSPTSPITREPLLPIVFGQTVGMVKLKTDAFDTHDVQHHTIRSTIAGKPSQAIAIRTDMFSRPINFLTLRHPRINILGFDLKQFLIDSGLDPKYMYWKSSLQTVIEAVLDL